MDDPHRRLGDRAAVAEPVELDVQDPADLVDPLEVAAELEEVEDLGPRQGAVDQAVEEDAGPLDPVEEPRRAGGEPPLGPGAAQVEVELLTWLQTSPLSVSWVARAFSRARASMREDRVRVLAVEGEEAEDGLAVLARRRRGPSRRRRGRRGSSGRSRSARGPPTSPARPDGVELEVEPDVEQPGDVLGPLDVAADPVEVLGDPAEHLRRSSAASGAAGPGVGGAAAEDPGVLGPAPLRAVDHQAPPGQGHPGQAAGQDLDLLAVEDERAEVDVPAFEVAVDERRVLAQADRRLGDVAPRVGLDLAARTPRAARPSRPGRSASRSRPSRRPP